MKLTQEYCEAFAVVWYDRKESSWQMPSNWIWRCLV